MARIKITDIPKEKTISKEEMKVITGGWSFGSFSKLKTSYSSFSSPYSKLSPTKTKATAYWDTW